MRRRNTDMYGNRIVPGGLENEPLGPKEQGYCFLCECFVTLVQVRTDHRSGQGWECPSCHGVSAKPHKERTWAKL